MDKRTRGRREHGEEGGLREKGGSENGLESKGKM